MKYLFLIVRHFFPRRRWRIIQTTEVMRKGEQHPVACIVTMQDQFGNLKTFKLKN